MLIKVKLYLRNFVKNVDRVQVNEVSTAINLLISMETQGNSYLYIAFNYWGIAKR